MRIKLFESFLDSKEQNKLKQDINDVLVELADLGFRWEIYINKNLANWQIAVDINKKEEEEEEEEEEEDYEDLDYGVAEIYESVMLLISFMRDKYPDVKNYNEEEIDEYLEENDFETIEHINATPMDAIYNFQVIFSEINKI
jgi:hypothetical protein